uniref:Uncharacterized protein n=1 Tax=Triticum urartu TaxID=4572 RepID=A0A8R7R0Z1_TRIUA
MTESWWFNPPIEINLTSTLSLKRCIFMYTIPINHLYKFMYIVFFMVVTCEVEQPWCGSREHFMSYVWEASRNTGTLAAHRTRGNAWPVHVARCFCPLVGVVRGNIVLWGLKCKLREEAGIP